MNRELVTDALGRIRGDFIEEAAFFSPAGDTGKETHMHSKTKSARKLGRILLIAAVIAALMGVTAYAAGWIGPRAIVIEDTDKVSLTQPQAAPEDMDPAIAEKLAASTAAWAEWKAYLDAQEHPDMPAIFREPEGCLYVDEEPTEDGGVILRFYGGSYEDGVYLEDEDRMVFPEEDLLEERAVTAEDVAARQAFYDYIEAASSFESRYDWNYGCTCAEDEAVLEGIAARYGLALRGGSTLLWSWETVEETRQRLDAEHGTESPAIDYSGPQWLSNKELTDRIAAECCSGDFFYETPVGYDKFYYFSDGSFCVSWYYTLPGGQQITCYGYNSMYATLSSGHEVVDVVGDVSSFTGRTHTCPDGTEVTILRSGEKAFLYVYLENSFFNEEIHGGPALTDADLDAIADAICYSHIGR